MSLHHFRSWRYGWATSCGGPSTGCLSTIRATGAREKSTSALKTYRSREFNHLSNTIIAFASSLSHYKSLTPSKSMLQKGNHDFKEKYTYIRAGPLEPMHIKGILINNQFFCRTPTLLNTSKIHNDMEFYKWLMVVDISIHFLRNDK